LLAYLVLREVKSLLALLGSRESACGTMFCYSRQSKVLYLKYLDPYLKNKGIFNTPEL
jgi:hypothetical protein